MHARAERLMVLATVCRLTKLLGQQQQRRRGVMQ